jgi:hypothetical protein
MPEPIDGEPIRANEQSLYDQLLALLLAGQALGTGDDDVLAGQARERVRAAIRARRKDIPPSDR